MSRKREVTIGVTINLENYENLRLEVEGGVETHEDVDDLIRFLDGMLARLGRGDPVIAGRVDAYRQRVLALKPPEPETATPPVQQEPSSPAVGIIETATPPAPEHPSPAIEIIRTATPPVQQDPSSPAISIIETATPPAPEHPPAVQKPDAGASGLPEPEVAQAPLQPEPLEAKPPAAPAGDICEICGAEVTKSQAKLSRLFMSKTLCKKCMEQP